MNNPSGKNLIVITGATATGKTDLSIKLAKQYKTSILSADSRQIYKELNIGVAKPSSKELELIQHFNIGFVSIHDTYSVGRFESESMDIIRDYFEQHDTLICSGGTGLYIDVLRYGIDRFPGVPVIIKRHYEDLLNNKGLGVLKKELERRDPEYFEVVDINNGARLVRALAVCESSGRKFSDFLTARKIKRPFNIIPIVLEVPRPELYDRINTRVDQMMNDGLLNEVETLISFRHLTALQTVGYKELFRYLDGEISLLRAIDLIKQKTRNYAKRQITWFKGHGTWSYLSANNVPDIEKFVSESLDQV